MRCFDSDSIKSLAFLPRAVAIVGGGIIAIEFARIFAALGARVTMVVSRKLPVCVCVLVPLR
jgi:pyruvate/2-oxoglutarate dehydrogenase complex dihydrolipoamide dehydrogenase (E3) component